MTEDAQAWGDFWANNAGGSGNGCLPERWAAIEQAQRAHWLGFAGDLADGAAVLDLATGDGRVLGWLRAARADLALEGIDLAPTLPPPPEGTRTRGGVAMEALPFESDAFDAVISQFGFEYGDVAAVAGEIARVLRPGGRVALMVHRGDGPILEHNRARLAAIEWALEVTEAVAKALDTPGAGPPVAAQVAAAIARLGANKFGADTPAWEIPEALRRACVMGEQAGAGSIRATLDAVHAQAANEVGRIRSLARACARADDRGAILAGFAAHGLALEETREVTEPSGRALADFLRFSARD